jgi:preprotein translocase subunit YajC
MLYPEFHHIGFKIISTYFMFITIKQNEQKNQELHKIKLALEKGNKNL